MLNGRFDFFFPRTRTQIPMFRLLGAPDAQKRRVVYDTGHNIPRPDLIRESLDWLDKQLGQIEDALCNVGRTGLGHVVNGMSEFWSLKLDEASGR